MKTSKIIMICLVSLSTAFTVGNTFQTLNNQKQKIESYESTILEITEENFELEEQNAYLRKQIESMQMYIDMNINPQLYTLDVESEEQLKTLGEF